MAPKRLLPWIDRDKLNWGTLSRNPAAMHLLEANPDKIYRAGLAFNPAAIHLLEANKDKIDWWNLSRNPFIFEEITPPPFKQELIETVFHPDRVFGKMGGVEWLECM